jgi:hypothetical protein
MSGRGSRFPSDLPQTQAPVVVTFDGDTLVDTFGDLAYFTNAEDSESLLRLLCDLLVGQGDSAPLLRAVELSPGKYADVHVVPEGELRHLVLLDATTGVLEARELQQMKNEASLAGQKLKRELLTRDQEHRDELRHHQEHERSLRRRVGMLESISGDVRARLDALVGHAGVLAPFCADHSEAMRALGYIQRTAVYLEAQLLSYSEYLRGNKAQAAEPGTPERIALNRLASELRRLFGADESLGLTIEVASDAGLSASVEMDYPRVHQLLITLITLALDGAESAGVAVRLDTPGGDLLIRVDAHVDWQGEVLDDSHLPQADNPVMQLGLQACRQLVRSMGGQFDIERDKEDARLTHVRILLPQPFSGRGIRKPVRPGQRAVVAIDDPALAATVMSLLCDMDLEPHGVSDLPAFEAAVCMEGTDLVVLGDAFDGEPGAALIYRLHDLGVTAPVVLLSHHHAPAVAGGWQRKHRRVVVAADAGREVLAAALRDAAEHGAVG